MKLWLRFSHFYFLEHILLYTTMVICETVCILSVQNRKLFRWHSKAYRKYFVIVLPMIEKTKPSTERWLWGRGRGRTGLMRENNVWEGHLIEKGKNKRQTFTFQTKHPTEIPGDKFKVTPRMHSDLPRYWQKVVCKSACTYLHRCKGRQQEYEGAENTGHYDWPLHFL